MAIESWADLPRCVESIKHSYAPMSNPNFKETSAALKEIGAVCDSLMAPFGIGFLKLASQSKPGVGSYIPCSLWSGMDEHESECVLEILSDRTLSEKECCLHVLTESHNLKLFSWMELRCCFEWEMAGNGSRKKALTDLCRIIEC